MTILSTSITELPNPEPHAAAHSTRVAAHIRHEINSNGGQIPFSRFMELALYSPGLGYYSAGAHKFGAQGDFVTAPELSPLFSRCVARQCEEILGFTSREILELGAGTATMAATVLQELDALNALPNRYTILELSGDLRARQQETLKSQVPQLVERVRWIDSLPKEGFQGIIMGNEVLDAMPVERFRITPDGPRPLHVTCKQDHFVECEGPANQALNNRVAALAATLGYTFPMGYESEINVHLKPWLAAFAERLYKGALLFLDYGYPRREYFHSQRSMGTLLCHYRHRVHSNPFILPGLQDITANVDFSAVADAAIEAGLELAGYTSQNYFLLGCGLETLLAEADPKDTPRYLEMMRQVKLLTLPGEMGERYKAIALTRGLSQPLRGFSVYDERKRL
jgi:SAM-dependent MidA family methyltransferase